MVLVLAALLILLLGAMAALLAGRRSRLASALPPLNGLVGEWLIYLGLLRSGLGWEGFAALSALLLVGLLGLVGLVGALALVAFTRMVGIGLLGAPRSPGAAAAREVPGNMRLAMALPFLFCLALGLYPQGGVQLLAFPLRQLDAVAGAALVEVTTSLASLSHWAAGLWLALLTLAALLLRLRRQHPAALEATWGCGFAAPTPRMAYTGAGFAEFSQHHLLPALLAPAVDGGRVRGLLPAPAHWAQHFVDPCLQRWLLSLVTDLGVRCERLRWLQQGRLPIYLLYIFLSCALLLGWSVFAGGG